MDSEFPRKLAALASVGVQLGVNLQPGQELLVSAPIEAAALVRHMAQQAYHRGAKLVTCLYEDPALIRTRFDEAPEESLDYAPAWLSRGVTEALAGGAARLFLAGPYPDLLTGIDPDKIRRAHAASAAATAEEMRFTSDSRVNWSVLPFVTSSWASMVFPGLAPDDAVAQLWQAVFHATRIDRADPVAEWRSHTEKLNTRRQTLQAKQYTALRFYDGRTDLIVGLAKGHRWLGGSTVGANGVEAICNLPSEEIFTCPDRRHVEGRVFLSKPLAIAGALVEDVILEFRQGLAVSVTAAKGQPVLEALLAGDEGSRRLGEIALVPHSSPISASGLLFYNALFDENAACHFALGQSYGATLSSPAEEGAANHSMIHIDCMFGTPHMNVDGVTAGGHFDPILRSGEFVF